MPRSESAENHIFWDMWPLGPGAGLNLKMDSSDIVPGRTTYIGQRHRKRFVDGRLVQSEPSPERRVYFPAAADNQVLGQRYPDADSAFPDWPRVQADLIAEGHPAERLAVMSVPSILALLSGDTARAKPSRAVRRGQKPQPAQIRAAQSYEWVCTAQPDLTPQPPKKHSRRQWDHILENECPA